LFDLPYRSQLATQDGQRILLRLADLARHVDIGARRGGITRRVIMHQDDGGSAVLQRPNLKFALVKRESGAKF
jgi:hypothetical protein